MAQKIFLDLDGVFADFSGRVKELTGKRPSQFYPDELWGILQKEYHFFSSLKVLNGSYSLYNYVSQLPKVEVAFLTALPRPTGNLSTAQNDKTSWVYHNLGVKYPVYTVVGGVNKAKFVSDIHDILIDDTMRNINAWERAGGYGIYHDGDYDKTIARLASKLI